MREVMGMGGGNEKGKERRKGMRMAKEEDGSAVKEARCKILYECLRIPLDPGKV